MTIEEIKELIDIVNESGVAELEVQRGDNRVRIRRTSSRSQEIPLTAASSAPMAPAHVATAGPALSAPSSSSAAGMPAASGRADAEAPPAIGAEAHELVKSPIVGTYYDSPAPGAAAFVRIGDGVEPGQVLCIIESMKLMNEIESEIAGTIVAKLVESGRPVEYGEALFAIRPR